MIVLMLCLTAVLSMALWIALGAPGLDGVLRVVERGLDWLDEKGR